MAATMAQQAAFRKIREEARNRGHGLVQFRETPDSKQSRRIHDNSVRDECTPHLGPEFLSWCCYCNAYVTLYFPGDTDEYVIQGGHPAELRIFETSRHGRHSQCLASIGGNLFRYECGEQNGR